MRLAFVLVCIGSSALADDIRCAMEDGTDVAFIIDRNQFVSAQAKGEPPRRKITQVTYGTMQFVAEPFIIGDTRGFYADGLGGTTVMFSVAPDGSAIYANTRSGERVTGQCETY